MECVAACEVGVWIVGVVPDLRDESINRFMVEDATEAYNNATFVTVGNRT